LIQRDNSGLPESARTQAQVRTGFPRSAQNQPPCRGLSGTARPAALAGYCAPRRNHQDLPALVCGTHCGRGPRRTTLRHRRTRRGKNDSGRERSSERRSLASTSWPLGTSQSRESRLPTVTSMPPGHDWLMAWTPQRTFTCRASPRESTTSGFDRYPFRFCHRCAASGTARAEHHDGTERSPRSAMKPPRYGC
jgi:hypothetical protein